MKDIEKNRAINILVPRLIDKTKNLQKEIKSRILLNKIFSEFENKASNKLNYFIKNSRKRYNCGKFGNNIDSFLSETERDNIKEANKIINNDFYKDSEMKLEKKKMKYKSTTKLFSDINDIFEKIKYPLDEKFNRNSRKQIQLILNNKDIEKPKSEIQKVIINKISPKQRNIIRFYNQKARTTDKQVINSQLEKDQKSIQNSIDEYLNKINSQFLTGRINSFINNQGHQKIQYNLESYNNRPKIKFPKINLLNYYNQLNRPIQPKIIKRKIFLKSPDISKVLPYYKSFKKKEKKEKNSKENNKIPFITEVDIKVNKKDYDYDNTQDIVYSSANNELNIKQKIDNKRKLLDDLLGFDNIPRITVYNKIIKQKKEKMKLEKLNKIKSTDNFNISIKEKMNNIINNEMKKLEDLETKLLSKSKIYK